MCYLYLTGKLHLLIITFIYIMKSFLIKTLPIFLLFISLQAWGQQDNFPVKKINGTDYYLYTVQQGEGLYSISKRFNVSQAEINNLNPQIHEGLKAGQEIVIPINEKNIKKTITSSPTQKSDKEKTVSKKETEIVKHIVLKKQTIFAISKIYNISIDDIKKHNPEVENGLKVGMILNIPIDDATKAETEKINKQSTTNEKEIKQYYNRKTKDTIVYIEHIVKEKETLYSISKLYNTEIQSIIDLNPKSDDKLKIGSKLKILKTPASKTTENEKPIVSAKAEVDNVKFNTRIFESVQPNKTPYKIAFLLPFMVGNSKADASIDKFIEFYSGALIAIQEAKEHGISFEISTFDTEKSEEKIQEVLQNPELKNMDLIIGPAYTNQIPFVSDFSKENKINTLIPFSSKVYDVNVNPYLLQFNPGIAVEVKFIAEMLNNEYRNDNIVFCDVPSVSILDDGYEFAFELQNELRRLKREFSKTELIDDNAASLLKLLEKDKKNVVFFNTNKYSSVSNYIDSLATSDKNKEIVLFTQYSWPEIKNAQLASFSIAPFKSDFSGSELNLYNKQFSKLFNWKPTSNTPRYDILGYDLTNYFVALMYNHGNNFSSKRNKLPVSSGIQSQLKFERVTDKTGYVNKQLYYFLQKNK